MGRVSEDAAHLDARKSSVAAATAVIVSGVLGLFESGALAFAMPLGCALAAALGAIARPVRPGGRSWSPAQVPALYLAVVAGPLAAGLAALAEALARATCPPLRAPLRVQASALGALIAPPLLAGIVAQFLLGLRVEPLLAALAAAALWFLVQSSIAIVSDIWSSGPLALLPRTRILPVLATVHGATAALVALVLLASERHGALFALLGVPFALLAASGYRIVALRMIKHAAAAERAERMRHQVVEAFALAIDARDPRARGHARGVATYARVIAERFVDESSRQRGDGHGLGVDETWVEDVALAAMFHDIGKLGLPDHLLLRSDAVPESELDRQREHAELGARIVARLGEREHLGPMVRHHHERWDGRGYPDGLAGEAIPLPARILRLADALDRLEGEAGHAQRDVESRRKIIARGAGREFDPSLVELYCRHADDIETRVAESEATTGTLTTGAPEGGDFEGEIERAHRESGLFFALARHLGRSLELEEVTKHVVEQFSAALPAHSSALFLLDPREGDARAKETRGPLAPLLARTSFVAGEGILGWVLETAEPTLDADPRVDLGRGLEGAPIAARSMAAFPIRDERGVLGVMVFLAEEHAAFREEDGRVVTNAMPQVASALRNALVYEETRDSSITDSLTGLPNSRSLAAQLEREMARATRNGSLLGVVVLDLDRFKPINDTYGHRAGDRVLREIAMVLRRAFRACDHVYRYAGDEFVALLPEVSPESVEAIVERVQSSIDGHEVSLAGGESVRVGVSAGVSCFPIDGSTLEELVHRADKAMYRDKAVRHAAALGTSPSS